MLCAKVLAKDTEKVRKYLEEHKLLAAGFKIEKLKAHTFIPLTSKANILKKFPRIVLAERKVQKKQPNLQKKGPLGTIKGFDVIGDIAILEIPDNLIRGERQIAESILVTQKNIKTVLKKAGEHKGIFRTQKMKFLAGTNKRETIHKEHDCLIKLDVEKVYFSPRLSNERKRIFTQVKDGEIILVMFSGCGPYPITISRNSSAKQIYGIEINPVAHKYALSNLILNKTKNVQLIMGDARVEAPKLKKKFDRIIMPLPKDADDFLAAAFSCAKRGTKVHLYDFLDEISQGPDPQETISKINEVCKERKFKCKILGWVRCGQIGVRSYRICIDFTLN